MMVTGVQDRQLASGIGFIAKESLLPPANTIQYDTLNHTFPYKNKRNQNLTILIIDNRSLSLSVPLPLHPSV